MRHQFLTPSLGAFLGLIACTSHESPLNDSGHEPTDTRPGPTDTADSARPEPEAAEDDARILKLDFPDELACGEEARVSLGVRNIGGATWHRDAGYKLGTVDDQDPFYSGSTRVWLPPEVEVGPQEAYFFEFDLIAPDTPGTYHTDWQMVREHVHWFGETGEEEITVHCEEDEEPQSPSDPPDLNEVTWLHTDVSQWAQTGTLSTVSLSADQICLDYNKANSWPIKDLNGTKVVGNPWIFIWENERWYAATWEWLRPGQICKSRSAVAGDHIKQSPFNGDPHWTPKSGKTYWFMVSGLARSSLRNVEERTNLMKVVWP
jgi:hypothetical protein